jgi:GH25 family lysozyme M1 (1,4-beta-N-acetylmuramidase)
MTVYGWDASHYDAVPSGARVVSEGFGFMTHKAGGDADDPELAAWWSAMKGQRGRLLLGAYWVLYPGSASSRADAFLARLDSQCPGWRDGPFILQADCEKWNGDASTVPGKADIKTFCDRLVAKVPKLRPIVYAPQWVYEDSLAGLEYPLWASSYVTGTGSAAALYPGDSSSRWDAYSGQTPAILQFTSSATIAGQTTSDANAYRGTPAQLTALLAPGWTEDDVELTDRYGDDAWPKRTVQNRLKDDAMLRDVLWGDVPGTKVANLDPDSPLAKLLALPEQMTAMAEAMANRSSTDTPLSIAAPTDRAVLDALAGDSVEDIVAALKAALGDKAAEVGAGLTA